jgi:Raf kinase inhibitor-like YbhB/YbcL family protein
MRASSSTSLLAPAVRAGIVAFASLLPLSLGCGRGPIEPRVAPGARLASITVTSPAFTGGGRIPVDHTCDGRDQRPELVLSAPPPGTKALVVLVEDPDAASGFFTHMIAFDVSPDVRKLPGGGELTDAGEAARFGLNDFGNTRYAGPCPPRGEAHRYRFRVLALDKALGLVEGAPRDKVDAAMDGHVLGEGVLGGFFAH